MLYSFYPTKNLATFGDGGLVATKTKEHDIHIRALREYGWRNKFNSEETGINSRLDELHATILRVRLKYLDSQNSKRREIASLYQEGLSNTALTLPFIDSHTISDGIRCIETNKILGNA
jgi:dTDP-4-amino-4,6-dideoxygalactose transaminase